ncbi:TNT domain-containing protein [Mucilaginibacter sp. SMC90]|uniref:TNT domain-containing protein n=1 Tax=Mucilaginibacter sp. SMC90 TaxID=2929803 RepID=UPI001FB2E6B0|nr:TNT domain-containing protein [Mucilaginibacter sp. SMC90]UOE48254.1 TNT domain-containing protein [Mucilaginibacter sp. SMC90]
MKTLKLLILSVCLMPFLATAQTKPHHAAKAHHLPVRGVTYEDFKSSVADFADSTKKPLADSAWLFFKTEKWDALEKFFTRNNLNGGWPPNRGAVNLIIVTLKKGVLIDRYGGYTDDAGAFQDKGTFVSPKGVLFPKRALPDNTLTKPYKIYKILKPIAKVREGKIIPWFGKPGLGIQYEVPATVNDLKTGGYIEEVKQ